VSSLARILVVAHRTAATAKLLEHGQRASGAGSMSPSTVRVDLNRRGSWEIALPGERDRVTCETLDEARRVAYLCAAHRHPCELVVCDAYHRVLHREFIDGENRAEAGSLADVESR
jgi:hypothetical protein